MHLGFVQLLAATLACGIYQNIDNLALAAAYRIHNIMIGRRANLLIAGLSGLASGVAVALGCLLEDRARNWFGDAFKSVSCGILIMIGVWILVGYFRRRMFPQMFGGSASGKTERLPGNLTGRDKPQPMRRREALVAAVALALDNLAPSFIGGLSGTVGQSPIVAGGLLAAFTGLFSYAAVVQGQAVGRKGHSYVGRLAPDVVAGCLVIAVALASLIEDSNPLNPERWLQRSMSSPAKQRRADASH